jgi:hypothetical protein
MVRRVSALGGSGGGGGGGDGDDGEEKGFCVLLSAVRVSGESLGAQRQNETRTAYGTERETDGLYDLVTRDGGGGVPFAGGVFTAWRTAEELARRRCKGAESEKR